jgi:hypothetical protein
MRCREFRSELIELARGGAAHRDVVAHVEGCPACARFLEDQTALTAAIQSFAAEASGPSVALEARVMAALPERRMPVWRWAMAAGVAAAACLSALWVLRTASTPPPIARTPQFVTIPYTVPLSQGEPAEVWHTRIPVSALRAVGFPIGTLDPAATVEADILVSQDGRARAIRPVSISISN